MRPWRRWFTPDTIEEIEQKTAENRAAAATFRSIPTSGLKKAGTRTYRSEEDLFAGERKPGHTLKDEFYGEMSRAFSEEDQLQVYEKFVQKIMHGRAGYGGQPRERAEGITLRLWQEMKEDQGGG